MNSTSDAPTLSVVLPTYNERENILLMMREIVRLLNDRSFEIIVVDDNSPDGTWQVVEEFAREHPQVRLLRRMNARGLTSAYNDGIKLAQGRLVMWMDVDFSMSPERIPEMLRAIDAGADVAVGSRYISGGGDIRGSGMQLTTQLILSKIITVFCSLALGCRCSDWTSGYIMLKREILEGYTLYGDHGEYFIGLMYYLIKQRRAKITEIPYMLTPRRWGESKTATNLWGLYRRGTRYLHVIWRLRFGGKN